MGVWGAGGLGVRVVKGHGGAAHDEGSSDLGQLHALPQLIGGCHVRGGRARAMRSYARRMCGRCPWGDTNVATSWFVWCCGGWWMTKFHTGGKVEVAPPWDFGVSPVYLEELI